VKGIPRGWQGGKSNPRVLGRALKITYEEEAFCVSSKNYKLFLWYNMLSNESIRACICRCIYTHILELRPFFSSTPQDSEVEYGPIEPSAIL